MFEAERNLLSLLAKSTANLDEPDPHGDDKTDKDPLEALEGAVAPLLEASPQKEQLSIVHGHNLPLSCLEAGLKSRVEAALTVQMGAVMFVVTIVVRDAVSLVLVGTVVKEAVKIVQ